MKAALWCFAYRSSFEEAILRAAKVGQDADTTAAICGQIAGAHYGVGGIPARGLDWLAMRDEIRTLANKLAAGTDRQCTVDSPRMRRSGVPRLRPACATGARYMG